MKVLSSHIYNKGEQLYKHFIILLSALLINLEEFKKLAKIFLRSIFQLFLKNKNKNPKLWILF